MTMEPVFNPNQQQLNGLQQQQQQQHHNSNNNNLQQHQLYRNHHLYQHSQAHSNCSTPPTLHRPAHPPPPPPPPQPPITKRHFFNNDPLEALSQPIAPTASMRSNSTTDYNLLYRNPIQPHNYYANTHYQIYQPTPLQLHHDHHLQHQQRQLHQQEFDRPCNTILEQQCNPINTLERGSHAAVHHTDALDATGDSIEGQDRYIEEVIQAILAAKEALEKPIEERDDRDILLIDNLCSLVHGFSTFPKAVRRALAAQAVLIVIDEKGKELIVHNEELDSFCVLIFGECKQLNAEKTVPIRYYHIGDSFGVCEPTTETVRFNGHLITRCENCAFLCVKRDDFYTILTDPANYPSRGIIKHRDRNGTIVCVTQFDITKKSSDPLWTNHMQSANAFNVVLPDAHIIAKASEAYLLMSLVDGYDRVDPEYVDDFLLLFRVFMTQDPREKERKLPPGMIKLCMTLTKWLDKVEYRDKVVKIVLNWLSSYYHDFELNPDFSYLFFKVLESRLLNLSLNNQLHLLHVTLSAKSKTRHVTISRSSREQPLGFSISGGYEKNCGIFVTQVHGSNYEDCPHESLISYLKYSTWSMDGHKSPIAQLKPGDQILEVNGTNFAVIKLVEAQKKLDMSTHLSLTVKYNPSAFYEMKALPEGKRKSSLSSISSVSPYQPSNSQTKFTFMPQEQTNIKQSDQYPPASPLFSSNANFGFRSIIKSTARGDRSKLSSLINSSKQFVKQFKDSTAPSSSNFDTMSKMSDNISDSQSNDIDIGKTKSNPDLTSTKNKDRLIESGLSSIMRSDDLNSALKTDNVTNGSNLSQVNVLRVFNAANNEFRYLLIHESTTAREVVMIAVKEFNLTTNFGVYPSTVEKSVSSLDWHLYEVSVVPESKTIKQKCLSEQTTKLAERASLCSRFYIKSNSQTSSGVTRLDMGDDALVNEILKESPASVSVTSLNATLLAVELTLADFDKFRSIEPQQFVYDTFFNYNERNGNLSNGTSSADSASLKSTSSDGQEPDLLQTINKTRCVPKGWTQEYQEFADISNKEMFWVVCEILNERNISRRVKIVKQFVRVADVCSQLRNYNSMFAIISGLGHNCVHRLKRTFEKLKPKYKNQLEKMRSLFDPSKNMSVYRICLGQTPPPAIPLFPQIKKDLTFTKEGRSIFIRELSESSDDEESGEYSQDTIKRKSGDNLLSVKSTSVMEQGLSKNIGPARSISYTSFNNRQTTCDAENILVNFAEIRKFTERVRNVIYFSSIPYSNDLLTNTKENQRNQAQIKKMHEEWQMRKRIRYYIDQTLNSAIVNQQKSDDKLDQIDGPSSKSSAESYQNCSGKLNITYDEKTLYQRSLDVEPELNTRPPPVVVSERQFPPPTMQLFPPNQPQVAPVALNMHPPPSAANSSPTLSKSSSLSSCSSFNHHLPNLHMPRSNLTSSIGKFGTESTESLRKLRALSENVDDWKPYHHGNGGIANGNMNNNNNNCNTTRLIGDQSSRMKGIVPNRIFPPKGNR